jgi:hypothetical protein
VTTRVYLEIGAKKVFACALEWPGWCRSGKTEDSALESLASYAERYAPVAGEAGLRFPAYAGARVEVVERLGGSAATDFGVPERPATADGTRLTKAQAGRLAAVVEAAWVYFDRVVAGAPAELRKGPRGGGRDRDKIADHVIGAEVAYFRKLGLRFRQPAFDDAAAVAEMRTAALDVLRAARAPAPDLEKGWLYRYAARRIAWHALDHAWEIEDRRD